jgi:tetratricopeptide (TPR) repeat protein
VSARLKGIVMIKEEAELDARLSSFIRNPIDLKIKKEQIISDAESFYTVDPSFAGIFYLWLYIVDPNDMLALIYLGDALFRGGDLSAANKYYNEARRTHPESAMPLLRLGDIQNMAGHFETAKMLWKQAENAKSTDDGEELFKEMARTRPSMMKK